MDKFADKFETLLLDGNGAMYDDAYWVDTNEEYKKKLAQKIIKDILSECVGFAGCKMARRQLSVAHILEIESIEDDILRSKVEMQTLKIAKKMVVGYAQITTSEQLKQLITDAK
jgi:5-methylthioribose kinase